MSSFPSGGEGCRARLKVESATATYKTPMFKGKAVRKDVAIDVELSSTSTLPISHVELGVFLGASLKAIESNRASALPTSRFRELEDGGVAFRAEAAALIGPGATRIVRVERTALPLDRDLSSVTAVVADCRTLEAVGEFTLRPEPPPSRGGSSGLELAAVVLAVALAVVLVVRWLR